MKVEVRLVNFERLPGINLRINVDPLEALHRLEEIAKTDKHLEVRSNYEGDGKLHCNVVSFADRNESQHKGLFAMFVHWEKYGNNLVLQLAASWWNPDPPTYDSYVAAANRLFQPIITTYNKKYKTRHRMRIETREELLPRMTPKAKEAFDHFVFTANKDSLHPQDWEYFYRFIYVCYRTRNFFYEDEIRWFCRRAGFSQGQAESLQLAFHHCYHFYEWCQKGRGRYL
jgi:hypothetical protein